MIEIISVLMKVDGIGEEVVYCIVLGLKFSSCVGWVDINLLIKLVGNVSLLLIEFVIKVVNIGMVKLNNMLLKDCDSQVNLSKERLKLENFLLLRVFMMLILVGILSQL